MFQRTGPAVSNRRVDKHGLVLTVRVPAEVAAATESGHFFMIRRPGPGFPLLSRPFSIFDADRATGALSFLYEVVGAGTELLAAIRPGDPVTVLGPLGNAFEPDATAERHVMVAGGVGIAPFLSLARRIARPEKTLVLFGARDASRLLGLGEFERAGVAVRVATDDGSRGHRGTSVDLLREVLRERGSERWQLYACGPNPMLRAACAVTVPAGLPCQVSLEARMACGFGACVGCAFPVRSASAAGGFRYALVCKEGTVFDVAELHFPETAGAG